MKTSYFRKYGENSNGVSIALSAPTYFEGKYYSELAPHWDFLLKYKKDKDEYAYIVAYHQDVLSKLDPQRVWDNLENKVLLCWEKPDKFCHRRIVAGWLEGALNVVIPEI